MANTGNLAKSLMPGVKEWLGLAYKEHEQEHRQIFDVKKSDRNYEQLVSMGPTGLLSVKPEGENILYDDFGQGFVNTFNHIVYASGFNISREAIEDNQYMELAQHRSNMLGRSARVTKETVAANVLNDAFTTGITYGDGLVLGSAAHLLEKGGTFSNIPAVAADLS